MNPAITFLRVRPAESVGELWAAARRREGTTVVETAQLSAEERDAIHKGGLVAVATQPTLVEPLAWVLEPSHLQALARAGTPGWMSPGCRAGWRRRSRPRPGRRRAPPRRRGSGASRSTRACRPSSRGSTRRRAGGPGWRRGPRRRPSAPPASPGSPRTPRTRTGASAPRTSPRSPPPPALGQSAGRFIHNHDLSVAYHVMAIPLEFPSNTDA